MLSISGLKKINESNNSSVALIIAYSLYIFLADNTQMMLTIPFAIYALFRYLFLVHAWIFGEERDDIKGKEMLLSMIPCVVLVAVIIYVPGVTSIEAGG